MSILGSGLVSKPSDKANLVFMSSKDCLFYNNHKYVHMCIPIIGHIKHCPGEANDAPNNSKQHWWKDNELLLTDSPSQ